MGAAGNGVKDTLPATAIPCRSLRRVSTTSNVKRLAVILKSADANDRAEGCDLGRDCGDGRCPCGGDRCQRPEKKRDAHRSGSSARSGPEKATAHPAGGDHGHGGRTERSRRGRYFGAVPVQVAQLRLAWKAGITRVPASRVSAGEDYAAVK